MLNYDSTPESAEKTGSCRTKVIFIWDIYMSINETWMAYESFIHAQVIIKYLLE